MSIGDFPESFSQVILVGIILVGKSVVTLQAGATFPNFPAAASLTLWQAAEEERVCGNQSPREHPHPHTRPLWDQRPTSMQRSDMCTSDVGLNNVLFVVVLGEGVFTGGLRKKQEPKRGSRYYNYKYTNNDNNYNNDNDNKHDNDNNDNDNKHDDNDNNDNNNNNDNQERKPRASRPPWRTPCTTKTS